VQIKVALLFEFPTFLTSLTYHIRRINSAMFFKNGSLPGEAILTNNTVSVDHSTPNKVKWRSLNSQFQLFRTNAIQRRRFKRAKVKYLDFKQIYVLISNDIIY